MSTRSNRRSSSIRSLMIGMRRWSKTTTCPRALYDQARYTLQLDKNKLASLQQQAQVQLAKLDGNPDIPVTDHPLYRQVEIAGR